MNNLTKTFSYFIALCVCTFSISGCTILAASSLAGVKAEKDVEVSRSLDELVAIGTISNTDVLRDFPEAVALVGKKQTYILLKGAKTLQSLAKELDGNFIKAVQPNGEELPANTPLVFTTKDQEFFGTAWFFYKKQLSELSADELRVIRSIEGVQLSSGYYAIPVKVSGIIPTQQAQVSASVTQFKVGRQIALVKTEKREEWVHYPNPSAFFALPFAVVADLILLPIIFISHASH